MNNNNIFSRRVFLRRSALALGVIALLPEITSAKKNNRPNYFEHTILAMGTTARIGVYAYSESEANSAITKAFTHIKRLEQSMSVFNSTSEISKINSAQGDEVGVSDDMMNVLLYAKESSTGTSGAFDITVEPLMQLWGFREKRLSAPSQKQLNDILPHIGSELVELDEIKKTVRLLSPKTKLDLGGIAVGYALDVISDSLNNDGITSAFIDIGGDVFALGAPPDERGWVVEIPDPRNTARIIHTETLCNQALATSGNYLSFVVYEAKRYGHILSPSNGLSADRILSSTVIASRGIDVDALSTASFVLGEKIESSNAQFVLIDASGIVHKS